MTDTPQIVPADEPRLKQLIGEYLRRIDQGDQVDPEQLLAQHPDQATAFRQFLEDSAFVDRALGKPSLQPEESQAVTQSGMVADTAAPGAGPAQSAASLPNPAHPERLGRYRIIKPLGEGAMGSVYLAEDTELKRRVAVKVPKFSPQDQPELLERFYREARSAATLRHPNICPVYDIGEHQGTRYITMGYLSGPPLSSLVGTEKLTSERTVVELVHKIALALAAAHAKGIVHRDLKPANILLDENREPVITDFGLARRTDQGAEARLTQEGAIVGTPAYMAPEQLSGDSAKIGPACDVYALGVVMYELLTGQLPYRGSITAVLGQIVQGTPRPPSESRPDLDKRLEAICLKLMARTPAQRYASAAEAAATLGRWLERTSKRPSRNLIAAAALFLALLGGGIWLGVVLLRVRDKEGNVIAEVKVPEGGTGQIVRDGKVAAEEKANPDKPRNGSRRASPCAETGESPIALVRRRQRADIARHLDTAIGRGERGSRSHGRRVATRCRRGYGDHGGEGSALATYGSRGSLGEL